MTASAPDSTIVERYRRARRDPALAVLEGFHALKHALRFGAEAVEAACRDPERLAGLANRLAPDVAQRATALAEHVPADVFERLAPHPPVSGVIAIARRPAVSIETMLDDARSAPIVLLERPRHLGNLGAAVRVAAAADAAGVLTTGEHDPWHPAALRGGAGLHYAVPVARLAAEPVPFLRERAGDRPLVALDPEGEPLRPRLVPPRAVLAFGSERRGLSDRLLAAADLRVGLPMRAGVSSLNLATAVAATLYASRIAG